MEQARSEKGKPPFRPEEAGILARVARARLRRRRDLRERAGNAALRRAAFSFSLFPTLPEMDHEREADEIWRETWEEVGDCLRLAMFDYAAGKRK